MMTDSNDNGDGDDLVDALAVSRDLANRAAAALRKHGDGDFRGALMLDEDWLLCSPAYLADIARSLAEGRQAKDALHGIMTEARTGLGI